LESTRIEGQDIVTLSLILVYRFASYISLPAINMAEVGDLLDHFKNKAEVKQAAGLLGLFHLLLEEHSVTLPLWH
jgi:preprotein translocase subunit SecY